MRRVIFNSDNFGHSHGTNYGIMDAYQRGILTLATLMANMSGFGCAVKLKKEIPRLGVEVRLTLTCGKPLLRTIDTLTEGGKLRSLSYYQRPSSIDEDQLYQEWNTQIQKIYHAGTIPAHLDNHHHTRTLDENQKVVVTLARKYDLPVWNNLERKDGVHHIDYFEPCFDVVGEIDEKKQQIDTSVGGYLASLFMILREDKTIEVICHAAYLDQGLLDGSNFVYPRTHQVEFSTRPVFAQKVKNDSLIELVTYGGIQ